MTRQIIRRTGHSPLAGTAGLFRQFLVLQRQEKEIKQRRESIRDQLRDFAVEHGEVDEDNYGHRIFTLPTPLEDGGKRYKGFRRQRKTASEFLADKAEALATEKGILEQVQSTETYIDQDKIYAAHQEGLLTEEEVDSLFEETETFAFVADKA